MESITITLPNVFTYILLAIGILYIADLMFAIRKHVRMNREERQMERFGRHVYNLLKRFLT